MIEVTNIEKSFEDIKAIDHITARIEEGHVFGLIGTNGAGKSTFLRLLCGVLKADRGAGAGGRGAGVQSSGCESKIILHIR